MSARSADGSEGRGDAVPRDLPDQQATGEPEEPAGQPVADGTEGPEEDLPDTDVAGTGPRGSQPDPEDPDRPQPSEPTD